MAKSAALRLIEKAAVALYGTDWRDALVHDLGIGRATLYRWLGGQTTLTTTHPIFGQIASLLESKARDSTKEIERIHRRSKTLLALSREIKNLPKAETVNRRYAGPNFRVGQTSSLQREDNR